VTSRSASATASKPRIRVAPRAASTYGDIAGDFAGDYELRPDDWQQVILNDWLAVAGGRWASLTCGLSVPRQNGKNGVLEMRELFGMVGRGEKFVHTAHQVKTAQKHFRRLKHFFGKKVDDPSAQFPELNALVAELRNVNGQEAIYLHNGGSVEIVARSQGSGRGYTVDVMVCDEAQDMSDDDLEALLSTTSSAPGRDPQWIYTGTPPGPKANGEVFTRIRTEALSGKAKRHCWHEWSCEADVDLDSTDAWRAANPALGGRLLFEIVEGERSNLSDEGFARERLGMWSSASTSHIIDAESWAMVADPASMPIERLALGIEVAPDRSVASVALAGERADGVWHVELDEQRSGTGWIVPWVAARCERNNIRAVVVDQLSPAASLLDDFAKAKVKVTTTSGAELANACGQFYDGVMDARLRHTDQPQVNVALSVVSKRPLGDRWVWNRKTANADITPIVAESLALWGSQAATVKRAGGRRSSGRKAVVM
jgi:hypothetical protein